MPLIILIDNRTTVLPEYPVIIIIPYKVLTKEREMERFKKTRKAKKQTKERMECSSQNKSILYEYYSLGIISKHIFNYWIKADFCLKLSEQDGLGVSGVCIIEVTGQFPLALVKYQEKMTSFTSVGCPARCHPGRQDSCHKYHQLDLFLAEKWGILKNL